MEFTKITIDNPVVIPPTEEKVYDKQWVSQLVIRSKAGDKTSISAVLIPYKEGVGTIDEPREQVHLEDVFGAMVDENRPQELRTLLAQTMELILQTVKAEKEYQKTLQSEEEVI
jgi:hypothetical protein